MIRKLGTIGLIVLIASISYALTAPLEEKAAKDKPSILDAAREMAQDGTAEIFKKSCSTSGCHRGAYPKAKLNLEPEKMSEAIVNVPSVQIEALKLFDTSDPEKSYLLMKIRGDGGIKKNRMPINAPPLTAEEIQTVRLWIHVLHIMEDK